MHSITQQKDVLYHETGTRLSSRKILYL